jgi:hypothetical protein
MRCPPKRLQQNLDAGWSLTKDKPKKAKKVKKESLQLEGFEDAAEQSSS